MADKEKAKAGKVARGDKFSCSVCGIVVTVDEPCGCMDACDIICCGKQMTTKSKEGS